MLAALAVAASRFIVTPRAEQAPLFVVPRGIVVLLALLAAITFLTEGAILDWGALLPVPRGMLASPLGPGALGKALWPILAGAVVVCFVATIHPARQAARVDPAEALRYE